MFKRLMPSANKKAFFVDGRWFRVPGTCLLEAFKPFVNQLRREIDFGPAHQPEMFDNVIEMLADYVQALPASLYGHYRQPGGMLAFALRVAYLSQRKAHGFVVSAHLHAEDRSLAERAWRYAALLAGLVYPLGALARAEVHIQGRCWRPQVASLGFWLDSQGSQEYQVRFRAVSETAVTEDAVRLCMASRLVPEEALTFIAAHYPEVVDEWTSVLAGVSSAGDRLYDVVHWAFSTAIQEDVTNVVGTVRGQAADNLTQHVIDALRGAAANWRPNVSDSPLRITNLGVFIVWPTAVRSILTWASTQRMMGIPEDPALIARLLLEAEIIVPTEKGDVVHELVIDMRGISGVVQPALRLIDVRSLGLYYTCTPVDAVYYAEEGNHGTTEDNTMEIDRDILSDVPATEDNAVSTCSDVSLSGEQDAHAARQMQETQGVPAIHKPATRLALRAPALLREAGETLKRILDLNDPQLSWWCGQGRALKYPDAARAVGASPQGFMRALKDVGGLVEGSEKDVPWLHELAYEGRYVTALVIPRQLLREADDGQ